MKIYAISDTGAGYIQWIGKADDKLGALARLDDLIGLSDQARTNPDEWAWRALSEADFHRLRDCAGDDQDAIDYLNEHCEHC